METHPELSLKEFTGEGYSKGRSLPWLITWYAVSHLVFQAWWCPARARPLILRVFGASVGSGVIIRSRVRVHWPWKLVIGDNCWIGEGAWLLNLERIVIGHDVCVSQEAFLCTGSHDRKSKSFEFDNGPIEVGDRAWLTARSMILRGTRVPPRGVIVGRFTG